MAWENVQLLFGSQSLLVSSISVGVINLLLAVDILLIVNCKSGCPSAQV